MLRWFLADLRTGRQILDLPVAGGSWERYLNAPERLQATLDMADPDTIALRPLISAAVGRSVLACAEGDVILGAGPIWSHQYGISESGDLTLELGARGVWSYYDHRFVLPLAAASTAVTEFTIPDPANDGGTKPNPALGTYLTNWELGTIAKKWVQQAHLWTGGSLPIVFEADRVGVHERNIEGAEFKRVGTVLGQLTEVEGGPDVRFMPRLTVDRLGIEWVLQTGTQAEPMLFGVEEPSWNLSAPESGASSLRISADGSGLAGLAWATGGRIADEVLVARAADSTLVTDGAPLLETLDSSHQTVSEQSTLDAYAAEDVLVGRTPDTRWSFTVEADMQPFLGSYWEGDFCQVDVAAYDPTTGSGDSYLYEGGTFDHRIVSMSGSADSRVVSLDTVPRVVS